MPALKQYLVSFLGRVTLRVIHTSTWSSETAAIRIVKLLVPTRIILDASILR